MPLVVDESPLYEVRAQISSLSSPIEELAVVEDSHFPSIEAPIDSYEMWLTFSMSIYNKESISLSKGLWDSLNMFSLHHLHLLDTVIQTMFCGGGEIKSPQN